MSEAALGCFEIASIFDEASRMVAYSLFVL